MYIHSEAVEATLTFISDNRAAGSGVIFGYTYPEVIAGTMAEKRPKNGTDSPGNQMNPLFSASAMTELRSFLLNGDSMK